MIYTAPFDTITATLPANTYAFGVDMGRSYNAAGTFTVTLSSGQSYQTPVAATDGAVFFGITSDQPVEWATFTFDTYEFFVLDDFTYSHTPVVSVAVAPAAIPESGPGQLTFTFARTGSTEEGLSVVYTVNGTATPNLDYTGAFAGTGVVHFPPGSSIATLVATPVSDLNVEQDETVLITVAPGTGYDVGSQNSAVGTIVNDDTHVTVTVSSGATNEDSPTLLVYTNEDSPTNLVYTVSRVGVIDQPLSVNFSISGSASSVTDFTVSGSGLFYAPLIGTSPGVVVIPAGSLSTTITVDPTPDSTIESDEEVLLRIESGVGYFPASPAQASGIIINDDFDTSPPVITPVVNGTPGTNDWYVGNASVGWMVTDEQSLISGSTGCTPSTVTSDTSGVTITCTATSMGGTATQSVTIKLDATGPAITVIAPTNVAYIFNQPVLAYYLCSDAVSLVASCVGAVPNGGLLDTSSLGTKSFTVNSTDMAGNISSTTVHYMVAYAVPTNKDQCKNGGWQTLQRANGTLFNNQGDCVSYVNTDM